MKLFSVKRHARRVHDGAAVSDFSFGWRGRNLAKKKEWRESRSNGKIYIDFIGTLDAKVSEVLKTDVTLQTIIFKFVIMEDGEFGLVLVSVDTLMKNGASQTGAITDMKGILAKIYANEEIKL